MNAPVARRSRRIGIDETLSREEYERLPGENWSRLKHLARSPAHYQHERYASPPDDTPARKIGRCAHLAVLEPEVFTRSVAVWTGGRRAGNAWELFCEQNDGRELLTEAEHAHCLAIAEAVRSHPVAGPLFSGGAAEVTIQWDAVLPALGGLPEQRIPCKGRVDYLRPDCIVDLKTTRDASPSGFGRESWTHRYHVQGAWYSDGHEAATGRRLPYVLVAVESTLPLVVQVYRVPEPILELGRAEYRPLLERLAFCRSEDRWGGYSDGELELTLPPWATRGLDDDDADGLDLEMT